MQVGAEIAEGGNFIDVRFGPLTRSWPAGNPLWNYHIGATSPAINRPGNQPSGLNVNHDFDNQTRPQGPRVDVGADEVAAVAPPPTLTSIAPTSGAQGAINLSVTLTGTNLTGATAVNVSGTGVTCGVTGSTPTTVAASCNITAGAAIAVRTVSVTTPGGTSGTVNFTVVGPLKSIANLTSGGNNSGGGGNRLVTVTVTAHGYATGNHVAISGVAPAGYNGTKTITVTNANTFTYTVSNGTGAATSFAGATAQQVP